MIGKLLRASARQFGYQFSTDLPCFLDGSCRQAGLTPAMALTFAEYKLSHVRVFQIGANDGLRNDYLHPFLERGSWSGVLVEADPRLYMRLTATNRHREARIRCVNVGIGDGSEMPFYSVDMARANGMPAWVEGLGGFVASHIHKHAKQVPGLNDCIVKTMLKTITPSALINREFDKSPDVVVTDCEGYDSEIIRMFNFGEHRPSVYIFESRHIKRRELDLVFRLFARYGYLVSWGGQDSIAIHESLMAG